MRKRGHYLFRDDKMKSAIGSRSAPPGNSPHPSSPAVWMKHEIGSQPPPFAIRIKDGIILSAKESDAAETPIP